MKNLPMALPRCTFHPDSQMALRPERRLTDEQKFCGVWYDCPSCTSSVLFPSPEVRAIYARAGKPL